jgi:hypothetical protein
VGVVGVQQALRGGAEHLQGQARLQGEGSREGVIEILSPGHRCDRRATARTPRCSPETDPPAAGQ